MLNSVCLTGRLTARPELKTTTSGVNVTTFTLAVERNFVKTGEQRETDFINIVAWRNTADFICKHFDKGQMMTVTGSIQTRNYEDKNGQKRTAVEVIASEVYFCGSKENKEEPKPSTADEFPF